MVLVFRVNEYNDTKYFVFIVLLTRNIQPRDTCETIVMEGANEVKTKNETYQYFTHKIQSSSVAG